VNSSLHSNDLAGSVKLKCFKVVYFFAGAKLRTASPTFCWIWAEAAISSMTSQRWTYYETRLTISFRVRRGNYGWIV
jgi:hypothetical protein